LQQKLVDDYDRSEELHIAMELLQSGEQLVPRIDDSSLSRSVVVVELLSSWRSAMGSPHDGAGEAGRRSFVPEHTCDSSLSHSVAVVGQQH
jgi:hypothetical protein